MNKFEISDIESYQISDLEWHIYYCVSENIRNKVLKNISVFIVTWKGREQEWH